MLPYIDATQNVTVTGPAATQRRQEAESVVPKAAEAYKNDAYAQNRTTRSGTTDIMEISAREKKAEKVDGKEKANPESAAYATDKVDINFSLTPEEKETFIDAFTNKKDPKTMSPEEKDTLQKASERISKFVEETIATNSDRRQKVEKAVGEWYSRITRGELEGPTDLVQLLRLAAKGEFDAMWE